MSEVLNAERRKTNMSHIRVSRKRQGVFLECPPRLNRKNTRGRIAEKGEI